MSTQIQLPESKPIFEKEFTKPTLQKVEKEFTKPTSQEVEKTLINVIKAGLYYRRPKEGKFMQSYKQRINKLRQIEDPKEYVLKLAQTIFPNEDKYNKI